MNDPRIEAAVTLLALVFGCAASPPPPAEPAPPADPEPHGVAPAADAGSPLEDAAPPAAEAPDAGASPTPPGRMAFTQCEEKRPAACTKEYRPVCAEVDTGIRCVKAPCPSTEKRTVGNACSACAEPKTIGYWPVACENLGNDTAR